MKKLASVLLSALLLLAVGVPGFAAAQATCTSMGGGCSWSWLHFSTICWDSPPDPYNHSWGKWTEVDGLSTRVCSRDVRHIETVPIAAQDHEHKYSRVYTEATCIEIGFTTFTCACGSVFLSDFREPQCYYDYIYIDATCIEEGFSTRTCRVCGDSQTTIREPNSWSHDWGEWIETSPDIQTRVCKRDAAHIQSEPITPLRYITLFGEQTSYESNFLNWILCIVFFGWIWMK